MAKSMTKAQVKRRLNECDAKLTKIFIDAKAHLSPADLKKVLDMITQCGRIVDRLR